jgi:chromosomal replication initiator protein
MEMSYLTAPGIHRPSTSEHILKICCDFYGQSLEQVKQKSRKREYVEVRQAAIALSKAYTKETLEQIANAMGGFDHSSCNHAIKVINNQLTTDKQFRIKFAKLENRVKLT